MHSNDVVEHALRFIGVSYHYGGNSPIFGFDCSGFVCEVLRSFGHIGKKDYSAQELYNHLLTKAWRSQLGTGGIVFFGEHRSRITHTGIYYKDGLFIESGGGTKETDTQSEADKKIAYVRIRPMRKDFQAVLKPERIAE